MREAIERVIAELEEENAKALADELKAGGAGYEGRRMFMGGIRTGLHMSLKQLKEVLNTESNNQNRGNTTEPERNS